MLPLPLLKPGLSQYEVVCLVRAGVQPAMRQTSAVQTDQMVRAAFSNELGMPYGDYVLRVFGHKCLHGGGHLVNKSRRPGCLTSTCN